MNDQELLKKLNNLKTIKADDNFKKNYREVLFSQISAGQSANQPKTNLQIIWESIRPSQALAEFAQPVWLASLASVLILAVGIGGVYASKNSKPGDSLYIAKIISEKAQLAITFDEQDKAKLGLEFATNRAKEITQVLGEAKKPGGKKDEQVQQLSQNFKNEISQLKNRLQAIKAKKGENQEDEPRVFGANLEKTNQRMEIAEPVTPAGGQAKPEVKQENAAAPQLEAEDKTLANATSTAAKSGQAGQMLEEAEKLFDEKNYNGTIDKLEEVNQVINQASRDVETHSASSGQAGAVKGESETASTTINN